MRDTWKQTYIALILKVSNPSVAKDFQPISLCNTVYKIIAKILSIRLSKVMHHLIFLSQTVFVPDQNIIDNTLLAQEIMHSLQSASTTCSLMLLKLDIEKAFDRVQWNFLTKLLKAFNFHDKFISWVLACITCPQFALLINGSPMQWFFSICGLR